MIIYKTKTKSGFIALISAIIISIILLLVVTNLSLTGFFSRSNVLDRELKKRSEALAEACADTAIFKLTNDSTYNPSNEIVSVDTDDCTIMSVSSTTPRTINVRADYKNYVTNLEIEVDTDLSVQKWEEI